MTRFYSSQALLAEITAQLLSFIQCPSIYTQNHPIFPQSRPRTYRELELPNLCSLFDCPLKCLNVDLFTLTAAEEQQSKQTGEFEDHFQQVKVTDSRLCRELKPQ